MRLEKGQRVKVDGGCYAGRTGWFHSYSKSVMGGIGCYGYIRCTDGPDLIQVPISSLVVLVDEPTPEVQYLRERVETLEAQVTALRGAIARPEVTGWDLAYGVVAKADRPVKAMDVAEALGWDPKKAAQTLSKLFNYGKIKRVGFGQYSLKEEEKIKMDANRLPVPGDL